MFQTIKPVMISYICNQKLFESNSQKKLYHDIKNYTTVR